MTISDEKPKTQPNTLFQRNLYCDANAVWKLVDCWANVLKNRAIT
jgi:hypothetical protein